VGIGGSLGQKANGVLERAEVLRGGRRTRGRSGGGCKSRGWTWGRAG